MSNNLIIGLGGTGGKMLAAYKRILFENKNGETDTSKFNVELLYIDSSGEDLKMKSKMWNIMGTDLSLNKSQIVEIVPGNIKPFIENSKNYTYLKNWVGTSEDWKDIINDADFQRGAGGQRRRLGRLNFAINAKKYESALIDRINKLEPNLESANITFHICAGLAGGTGSGVIVDICSQIRKKYHDTEHYPIILYLVLPEEIPNPKYATTAYYQPNGYAALMELNALAFSDFVPNDICEHKYDVGRVNLSDVAFNLAYIITEKNEQNIKYFVYDPTNKNPVGSLIQTTSEFLYQRTITNSPEILAAISRAEPMENKDDPTVSKFKFSRKFFAFGYKRFAIPEQEIKEYYSYFFGYQALLQFLFNNYNATDGYLDQTKSTSFNAIVAENSFLEKYNLTRNHLCLSREVLGEYKKEIRGINIDEDIQNRLNIITEEIKQGNSIDGRQIMKDQWLDAIYSFGLEYYKKGFRLSGQDGGVEEFYDRKRKDKDALAKKLVDNIERVFFQDDWNGGKISLNEIAGLVNAINKYLSDEKDKYTGIISNNLQRIKIIESELTSMKLDWRKGWINKIFNDSESKVKGTQKGTVEIIQIKTWNRAYLYATELIDAIKLQLNVLYANISFVNGILTDIKKEFSEKFYSRCNDPMSGDKSDVIIKYYDPQKIKNFSVLLSRNKEKLDEKIAYIRNQLYETARNDGSFFEKLKKLNKEILIEEMEKGTIALTNAFFANEAEIKILTDEKFIGENILAKLRDEFSGDDEGLKQKIKELILQASLLARFDKSQQDKDNVESITSRMVILPDLKGSGADEFKEKIRNYFADNQPNSEIAFGGNPSEIIIFNIKRGIQVRSFETVSVLKENYSKLMNSAEKRKAKFFCHIENVEILNNIPSDAEFEKLKSKNLEKSIVYTLLPPTKDEIEKLNLETQNITLPYFLIAKATGLIKQFENPETGLNVLCMTIPSTFDEVIEFDKTLDTSIQKINTDNATIITNEVLKELRNDYKHIEKQKELIQKMVDEVNEIQNRFDNNPLNVVVKRFKQAGQEAINIINNIND